MPGSVILGGGGAESSPSSPSDSDVREEIRARVSDILSSRFSGEKATVRVMHDRLNFACPFCGDSDTDLRKKRANIYWDNMRFCCFNSGCPTPRMGVMSFLSRNGKRLSDISMVERVATAQSAGRRDPGGSKVSYSVFSFLTKSSVPVGVLEKAAGLASASESPRLRAYLSGRAVLSHSRLFRIGEDGIYMLNMDRSGSVLGYQVRPFTGTRKYLSFNAQKTRFLCGLDMPEGMSDEEMSRVNTLSLYFGIMSCDFSSDVTVFEGMIDSLHVRNSLAIAGLTKDIGYLDSPRFRFLLDNDDSGSTVAERLMRSGRRVFLWKKYLKDNGIREKVKDINELAVLLGGNVPDVGGYFSGDPLDLIWL